MCSPLVVIDPERTLRLSGEKGNSRLSFRSEAAASESGALEPDALLGAVLVVPAEPVERRVGAPCLVAPARRPVEPLVHAPENVEPACVGRVRVVDDAVLEREGAH